MPVVLNRKNNNVEKVAGQSLKDKPVLSELLRGILSKEESQGISEEMGQLLRSV